MRKPRVSDCRCIGTRDRESEANGRERTLLILQMQLGPPMLFLKFKCLSRSNEYIVSLRIASDTASTILAL